MEKPKEKVLRQHVLQSYKSKADARRTWVEKLADFLTSVFGSITFLTINALWFGIWVAINIGLFPDIAPFDPFPFGLLTMIVSLEAIFLAIIVLISQNRAAKIDEVREEVDLQVNSIAEAEITQIIKMLVMLLHKNGIDVDNDPEIARMMQPVKSASLEKALENQLSKKTSYFK